MSAIETEVKFRVNDPASLERRLETAGFRLETPRTFERNVLYDTRDRQLRVNHQILRIRQYGRKWLLTHKALPPEGGTGLYKQRVETETVVGDGEAVIAIFASLGYFAAFTYEKWRTEWTDGTGHCVLDETPIGLYAELEGPESWIAATARSLEVDPSSFQNDSYGRLFDVWKQETGSSATNLTFGEVSESVAGARH